MVRPLAACCGHLRASTMKEGNDKSRRRVREREAVEYLGAGSGRTLQAWRCKGVGPAYSKLGKIVIYEIDDLDAFIAAGRIKPKRMS